MSEHLRGMSDYAPLYALLILASAIGLLAAVIGGLFYLFL